MNMCLSVRSYNINLLLTISFMLLVAACGGGSGSSTPSIGNSSSSSSVGSSVSSSSSSSSLALALFAGDTGGAGNLDGTGADVRFNYPEDVAVDANGNLYVMDTESNTIRKITSAGVVTTLAGSPGQAGSADGTGAAASFNYPGCIAIDVNGNLYVADTGNSTIRKVTSAGVVTTLAGKSGQYGSIDGTGSAARFDSPLGITVDANGNVYVADQGSDTIRKITPSGMVTTLAGLAYQSGSIDGTGSAARFLAPEGMAVDMNGNVYVADSANSAIRKITAAGVVTTLAGSAGQIGSTDGTGNAARFDFPYDVAVDTGGNVYVADGSSTIRKITSAGAVTTLAGSADQTGSTDGTGNMARFGYPNGLTVDANGVIFVADTSNSIIRKITSTGVVTTAAGFAPIAGSIDGIGSAAQFNNPAGLTADTNGNIYVADNGNSSVRKITSTGVVTTLAGAGHAGFADGTGSVAQFDLPYGVAVDTNGTVYVADTVNQLIRKVTSAGVVTTIAGSAGQRGSTDGQGSTARFSSPNGIAVDVSGNLYVADKSNYIIRKITPAGMVTTIAGLAGQRGSTDGAGSAARFSNPYGVAVDTNGNVYVTDNSNDIIRKIDSSGVVTTLAGVAGAVGSADGAGTAARFNAPSGITIDSSGNLYVADSFNDTIRKITPNGIVTTVVGQAGEASFIPGALPGVIDYPLGVAISGNKLFITMANAVIVASPVP